MDWIHSISLFAALLTSGLMAGLYLAVPLNNRLDDTEPAAAARVGFERGWVRWNAVRTVVCTLSFAAFALALVS